MHAQKMKLKKPSSTYSKLWSGGSCSEAEAHNGCCMHGCYGFDGIWNVVQNHAKLGPALGDVETGAAGDVCMEGGSVGVLEMMWDSKPCWQLKYSLRRSVMVSHHAEESRNRDQSLWPLLWHPFACLLPVVPICLFTGVVVTLCKPWVWVEGHLLVWRSPGDIIAENHNAPWGQRWLKLVYSRACALLWWNRAPLQTSTSKGGVWVVSFCCTTSPSTTAV